jgi:hypothetical protein
VVFSVGSIWRTKTDESVEKVVVTSLQTKWKRVVLSSDNQWRPDMAESQWPGVVSLKS